MKNSKLFGLLFAAMVLMLAIQPTLAQDVANPAYDNFSRDQILSAALSCDYLAHTGDGSYNGQTVAIPADGATQFPCEEVVGYEGSKYPEPQIADFSWMLNAPVYYNLVAQANVRVAPDASARLIGGVNPTTSPVVEVDAVYQVSDTEARLLIRTKEISGWINNVDAQIDLSKGVEKPADWALNVMPDALNNIAGGEPAGWSYTTLFAPNGDPFTDVLRTKTDLFGHGRLLRGTDTHFAFAIIENGRLNPAVTKNGFYLRVEGDIWRYFPNWQVGWPSGSAIPGTIKAPIVEEFMIKDAFEHRKIEFSPPYAYVSNAGRVSLFTQDEILSWPQVQKVLDAAVCPATPVRLNVAGDNNGETQNYDAAVGNSKCPSYLIGVTDETPAGVLDIMALPTGSQPQEVYYSRDYSTFIMVPDTLAEGDLKQWLAGNIGAIMTDLNVLDRVNVRFTGVPDFEDGTYPLLEALPTPAG